METNSVFLESSKRLFLYYKTIAEKAIDQIDDEQLFFSANEDTNSIAIIIQHLAGNMISRWTDFHTTDGEKDWRNRDGEFEENYKTKADLIGFWDKGWNCLFEALNSLQPEQLTNIVYIRKEGHTVMDAINRQLAHYPYHIGQIVFYAKMLKKTDWNSLSIPKNKSNDYNTDKFSKEKSIRNFTDDELKKLK